MEKTKLSYMLEFWIKLSSGGRFFLYIIKKLLSCGFRIWTTFCLCLLKKRDRLSKGYTKYRRTTHQLWGWEKIRMKIHADVRLPKKCPSQDQKKHACDEMCAWKTRVKCIVSLSRTLLEQKDSFPRLQSISISILIAKRKCSQPCRALPLAHLVTTRHRNA